MEKGGGAVSVKTVAEVNDRDLVKHCYLMDCCCLPASSCSPCLQPDSHYSLSHFIPQHLEDYCSLFCPVVVSPLNSEPAVWPGVSRSQDRYRAASPRVQKFKEIKIIKLDVLCVVAVLFWLRCSFVKLLKCRETVTTATDTLFCHILQLVQSIAL